MQSLVPPPGEGALATILRLKGLVFKRFAYNIIKGLQKPALPSVYQEKMKESRKVLFLKDNFGEPAFFQPIRAF